MAPILLDRQDLVKLGFISVLAIVFTFAGGFMFGHYQASMGYLYDSAGRDYEVAGKNNLPSKPVINAKSEKDTEQSSPVAIDAIKSVAVAPAAKKQQPNKKKPNKKKPAVTKVKDTANVIVADNSFKKNTSKEKASKVNVTQKKITKKKITKAASKNPVISGEGIKIKYSIQVAVYGRLNNAVNMMELLQAEELDAYVTDYTNKKNKVQFNVRFGRFANKKSAQAALNDYIKVQKGDGYLVNYSERSIVNTTREKAEKEVQVSNKSAVGKPAEVMSVKVKTVKSPLNNDNASGAVKSDVKEMALNPTIKPASADVIQKEEKTPSDNTNKNQAQSNTAAY